MSGALVGLPLSAAPGKRRNKRVLLVDTSATKRDLRAESLRKLGLDVDCAADISEARSWWRANFYRLVLIDMESGFGHRDKFCDDLRNAKPPQQISFFVGKPGYLADVPKADRLPMVQAGRDQASWADVRTALAADLPGMVPQRWGILEASQRISAVRSLSHARTRAIQDRPGPPREMETRESKRIATESRTLDDLLREELQ